MRLIIAGAIALVEHDDKQRHVKLTRAQIKDAPDYDAEHWNDDTRAQHGDYYDPYRS